MEQRATTPGNLNDCFAGDFDGNGKTDIACNPGSSTWNIGLSTGTGWNSTQWLNGPTPAPQHTVRDSCLSGDFNGDGKTDIVCHTGSKNQWNIWLTTGSGWQTSKTWGYYFIGDTSNTFPIWKSCFAVDLNGDGKTDIICNNLGTNEWQIQRSSGVDFSTFDRLGPTPSSLGASNDCVVGDFNGDGKTDIACNTAGSGNWSVGLGRSDGYGWNMLTWNNGPQIQNSVGNECLVADLTGDGKTDIACNNGSSTSWRVGINYSPLTDLLTSVSNGLGGTTTIAYTPSTHYTNTQLPFPVQTVSSVTTTDGNGNSSRTTYSYSGGYYHTGAKEFRGFNKVTVTGPQGPNNEQLVTETWFHQGNDTTVGVNTPSDTLGYMKGKPYLARVSDSHGSIFYETETTYRTPIIYEGDAARLHPYSFNPPTLVETYICDGAVTGVCKGTANARKSSKIYLYDQYGNVTFEGRYNDDNSPGNKQLNMTIRRIFNENTTDWILALPAKESTYQGRSIADADKIRETNYYYDGVTDCSTASTNQTPTIGNLTRIAKWYREGSTISETRLAYDDLGNPMCSRDPNGNISNIAYDPTYKTFPISSANAKNQTSTSTYFGINNSTTKGRYGQVESVTDPNNAKVTAEYDKLGRKKKSIQPDLFWSSTDYNDFGTVGSQRISQNNQLDLWSASYFDGMGRTFKNRRSGPDNKVIVTETIYDQRGKVGHRYLTLKGWRYLSTGLTPTIRWGERLR